MTTLLAIDTATPNLVVGLLCKNRVYVAPVINTIVLTDVVLPAIEAVLKEACCSKQTIDAMVVGIGPGSFIGVRTAIATAQGLALALNCPVVPVSSLELIAKAAYLQHGFKKIAVAWDARMQAVYFGQYCFDGSNQNFKDQLLTPAEIVIKESDWAAVGNGWQQYYDQFSFDIETQFVNQDFLQLPCAEALLQLGIESLEKGMAIAAEKLEANYIRQKVTSV
ncbi:MAG: tRNA (adenosine(37)-N6)-threonylcarbamoyltransferase complex dimerization subunit type 1 TsaB [Gammaproteobacteria bacterium RIFCSPHIGHO2_12_FULL_41_15]|nr:MAG: tRNA (adenosine(37)-N6)-threonylcarbamoyltransferase complex dimerization subunit type 1 TsaB [Gammaproteobacteria bacterium RIFCSPHIGHO2_12_FULL_41_15]